MSAYDVHIATARGSSPSLVVVPAFGDGAPMLACYFNPATRSWSGEVFTGDKWKPVTMAVVEDALSGLGGITQATEIVAAGVKEAVASGKSPARAVEALLESRGIATGTWREGEGRAKNQPGKEKTGETQSQRAEKVKPSLEKRRATRQEQGREPRKPSDLKRASGKPRAAEVAAARPGADAKACAESARARGALEAPVVTRSNPQR